MARRKTRKDSKVGTVERREGIILRNSSGRKTRKDKLLGSVRKEVKKRLK